MALFDRLKQGLARTHQGLVGRMEAFWRGQAVSPEAADAFLEVLLAGDVGLETAEHIISGVKERIGKGEVREPEQVVGAVKALMLEILEPVEGRLEPGGARPWVVMFVGVNGSGKTTTIAKLGQRWTGRGLRVSFAAADTFRAGAVEQLQIWAGRVGAGFHAGQYGADPSSVVYDALGAACSRGEDALLIDTAGRLHTSANLMEELRKVHRTCGKVVPGAPHETLLVLDSTTGQNGLAQARVFHEALGLTGLVLTKLDGTAKGGIIVAVARTLGLPIKLVGVGETAEDLQDFRAAEFVEALFAD